MSNINYAQQWTPELLDILIQGSMISPFITTNVKWLGAKTFHFTQMSTSGYKSHNRNGGWNRGNFVQADVPFTLMHDRDVEFCVDRLDVDESNATASIKNISETFTSTQSVPEANALFFSRCATKAKSLAGYHSETAISAYTADNVYSKLKGYISHLRRYRAMGALVMYVRSDIMDLLERSTELQRKIELTQIAEGGMGIETRVTSIDGVPIFEVIDDEVFYDSFDFDSEDGGFVPASASAAVYELTSDVAVDSGKTYYTRSGSEGAYTYTAVKSPAVGSISTYYEMTKPAVEGSKKINVLIASPLTTKFVPKLSSIYYFAPGGHTQGDCYLYQNRAFSDVFTFPNGKNNKIDSLYVDVEA